MRVGITVSTLGHLAILGFGFIAFPDAEPFQAEKIEALPIDLVTIAEFTDLAEGNKRAEVAPEESPQPKPQVQAEVPAPQPAEKPAEQPVQAARQPTPPPPPPPEPEAEPEPEPEPEEVAALPEPVEPEPLPPEEPPPEPAAEPDPPAPVDARVPRARPKPPKQTEQPEPLEPATVRAVAKPQQPDEDFNPDEIAALLDKRDPAGGGDPVPVDEPQTLGSIDGHANAEMTQSELAALQARLYQCWNPPVGVREAGSLVVTVRISLLQDGSLAGQPQLLSVGLVSDPLSQVAAESALRAVVQCSPFGDILRPEKYALWREIDFVFDPRQMLGG